MKFDLFTYVEVDDDDLVEVTTDFNELVRNLTPHKAQDVSAICFPTEYPGQVSPRPPSSPVT